MTCRELTEFLLDYLSGDLPELQRAEFDRHLAMCPSCIAYLNTYQKTVQLGQAAFTPPDDTVEEVPPELVQAVLKSLPKSHS